MKQNKNKTPYSIFQKPNLKTPPKFEDFTKEPNNLWIGKEIQGGTLSFILVKPFSNGPYSRSSIIHQFQFLPKEQQQMIQRAYAYTLIADHRTKSGKASCAIDAASKTVQGSLEQKFFDKKVSVDLSFNNGMEPAIDTKLTYKGSDFVLSGQYIPSKSKTEMSYSQSITPTIAGGVSMNVVDGVSSLSSALRYHQGTENNATTLIAFLKNKQGKDHLKLAYVQDIALGAKFGSEVLWKIQEKKLDYKMGVSMNWMKSQFTLNYHDTNKLQVSLNHQLGQKIMAQFTSELTPKDGDLAFSLGFQLQDE